MKPQFSLREMILFALLCGSSLGMYLAHLENKRLYGALSQQNELTRQAIHQAYDTLIKTMENETLARKQVYWMCQHGVIKEVGGLGYSANIPKEVQDRETPEPIWPWYWMNRE